MSDTESLRCVVDDIDVDTLTPLRIFPDSTKSAAGGSVKSGKLKKTVSFSNIDNFIHTEWQEPIYEGGADIESMILGDDDSSSHVSFNALDKSSAGTAMDTETFEELPRRLSNSSKEAFSMDLVIEKLLAHCRQPEIERLLSSEAYEEPINQTGIYSFDEDKCKEEQHDKSMEKYDKSMEVLPGICDLEMKPLSEGMSRNAAGNAALAKDIFMNENIDMNKHALMKSELIVSDTPSKDNDLPSKNNDLPSKNNDSKAIAFEQITSNESPLSSRPTLTPLVVPSNEIPSRTQDSSKSPDLRSVPLSPIDKPKPLMLPPLLLVQSFEISRKISCTTMRTNLSNGLSTSQQSTSNMSQVVKTLSATKFRRHERLRRHEAVAIDLGKGVESYLFLKLIKNILLLWVVIPVALCVLVYGIIPYDNLNGTSVHQPIKSERILAGVKDNDGDVWGIALIPMIFVISNMGALAVEIYSKIITEIEFGVLIIEDTPIDYFLVSLTAVIIGIGFQALIFAMGGQGLDGNW
eukprot:CAMPEP_0119037626 /NCGR_PEP_ID=MMETSP1177-20130426/6084_1 /TAXON_ID=2985 /ORGANISM="Ochromonas sp, Strain CCMP1899" /LENGTH=519 /DNA_ID=CAMNT_0006999143 /DNA_START=119 /DNA_END=1675 /DNA_ORIENTATION=+